MYGTTTKILSLLLIAILVTSNLQSGFQNFFQNANSNTDSKAFASNTVDITQISSYAVFGLHSVVIEKDATIVHGSVGVQSSSAMMISQDNSNRDAQSSDGNNNGADQSEQENAVLILKKDSKFLDPSSALVGDSILIEKGATVQNVFFNTLQNAGTILGTQQTPLSLPVVKSLPSFPHSTPSSTLIEVPDGTSLTLQPGLYGSISVGKSATLNFAGGIYNVISIEASEGSSLLFSSSSQVVVQNQIELKKGVTVGPSVPSAIRAHDIVFFVGGETSIEKNDTIKANIFSPNGDISIEKETDLTGSFIGKSVEIDKDSKITLDSAFVAFDLVNQLTNLLSETAAINSITDEAVVTDYLNQNVIILQGDTNTLVTDSVSRSTLLSILNSVLQSVSASANSINVLDETGANANLNQATSLLGNYVSQVQALSGNKIPTSVANTLVAEANSISLNSQKRDSNTDTLVDGTSLVITSQLIDRSKQDLTVLGNLVTQLHSIGFTPNLAVVHNSPTTAHFTFANAAGIIFDIVVPDRTIDQWFALTIGAESQSAGNPLTLKDLTKLLVNTPVIGTLLQNLDVPTSEAIITAVTCAATAIPGVEGLFPVCIEFGISTVIDYIATHTIIQHNIITNVSPQTAAVIDRLIPPVITSPTNGSTVTTVTITGISQPQALITVFDGATQIGLIVADSNGNWSLSPSLSSGSHTITATQTISNNISPKSTAVTFTFTPPFVFFENFDNPLSGWNLFSAFTACCGAPSLDQVTSAFGSPPPSPPFWGKVHAVANGVECLFNNFVDFQKSFTVSTPGNYKVSATIGAALCDVCVVDGRVDVDHSPVLEQGGGTISGGTSSTIALKSAVINIPSAGTHTLDLRMDTTVMCSGDFASYFDDVGIQQTSSPVTGTPVGGPYFKVQPNQTSVSATSPSKVVVPLQVIWDMGHSPEPVTMKFIGNTTMVVPSVISVANTTSSQLFNVTLNVQPNVQPHNYLVGVLVQEVGGDNTNTRFVPIIVKAQ